jgi:hypothetical protein
VFLALFIPVLLVEARVLKYFMRDYHYLNHLRLVFYPNIISSAVGSVLNFVLPVDRSTWGFYLIAAVIVEFPVVRYLYSKKISSSQALRITFIMNLASYILLLIIFKVFGKLAIFL